MVVAAPFKAWLPIPFALALTSGCNPAQETAAPPPPDTPVSSAGPRTDLPEEQRRIDLFGAWLIESVEGADPQLPQRPSNMILLVGNRQLEVLSQCITIGPFDYGRTSGGGIAVHQPEVPPRPAGAPAAPAPVQCARALSPAERAMPRILFAARMVRRDADGSVRLSGDAGTLGLRRPAAALANPRGEAPPPTVPPLLGAWRFVSVDGRSVPPTDRMELLLRPKHIEWRSGCVNETRLLERDRDMLLPGDVDPFPVCERGRTDAELAVGRLLAGPIAARVTGQGRLTLSGSGVTAQLAPLTS